MPLNKEFEHPPLLRSLLLKAAIARGNGKTELPALQRSLNNIDIDADFLRSYNRVCGFKDTVVIAPTVLHMYAFPMIMDMCVDEAFPFKPMGMVHVRNSITQHRKIRCSDAIDMHCQMQNLVKVDKGFEFDVLVSAKTDGELVWESVVTNLVRHKHSDVKDKDKGPREELDFSGWDQQSLMAPADIGRQYAKVSGDYNPIHLYPLTAKLLGFPRAIAHGMWTKAASLAALSDFYSAREQFSVDVKFKLPVLLPARLHIYSREEGEGLAFWLCDAKSGKPHIEATIK